MPLQCKAFTVYASKHAQLYNPFIHVHNCCYYETGISTACLLLYLVLTWNKTVINKSEVQQQKICKKSNKKCLLIKHCIWDWVKGLKCYFFKYKNNKTYWSLGTELGWCCKCDLLSHSTWSRSPEWLHGESPALARRGQCCFGKPSPSLPYLSRRVLKGKRITKG